MKIAYRVWWPQYNERPDRPNVESFDPRMAAEHWCETNHHRVDYPTEFNDIRVEDPQGNIRTFDVEVRQEMACYGTEKPTPPEAYERDYKYDEH